jgi:hypothetical protein
VLLNDCRQIFNDCNILPLEVREDGRLVVGKGWKESVYNREEWKKPLRTARNHHILHMPME